MARRMAAAVRGARRLAPRADDVILVLPGVALAGLALESGGFSPGTTAVATLLTLAILLGRTALAPRPLEGASGGLGVALAALGAFAIWVLLSQIWSDSASRALIEYSRVLLYLATLALFGLLGRTDGRARILLGALAAAAVAIGVAALAVWLVPDQFGVGPGFGRFRLNWPLSYWNAIGLLAGTGLILCVGLTCTRGAATAVPASAAVPLLAAVIYFSVSRGAAAATLIGVAVWLLVARSRAMLTGVPVAALGAGIGVAVAAAADVGSDDLSPSLLHTAHRAALLLALGAAATAAMRAATLPLDRRLAAAGLRSPRPAVVRAGSALLVVVAAGTFVAAGGPSAAKRAYRGFVSPEPVFRTLTPEQRFTSLQANGRIEHWDVALDAGFAPRPLTGSGAGTYPLLWARERSTRLNVLDGHSLYVETLGELGLVGLVLLLVALGTILVALGRRAWGARAGPWPVLFAAAVAWAIHAGVDWDWEMPAVTAWVFAAGGLALAAPRRANHEAESPWRASAGVRVAVAVACIAVALVPLSVGRSQVRLIAAVKALQRGDCRTAAEDAAASRSALSVRPEPYEILAYCALGAGRGRQSVALVDAALRRDPGNWELHYARALALAAAGRDPRRSAREALALNPRASLARAGVAMFATSDRSAWRREALRAALPVPPLEPPINRDPSERIRRGG